MGRLRCSRRQQRPFLLSSRLVPVLFAVTLALCLAPALLLCLICPSHHPFTDAFVLLLPNMMRDFLSTAGLLPLLLSSPAVATLLYASSYSGTITTLNLTLSDNNSTQSVLQTLSSSNGCAPSPSWLTLDHPNSRLYCTDEGLTTNVGTVSSFKTGPEGNLEQLAKTETISGPVSAVIYGDRGQGLAVAQ